MRVCEPRRHLAFGHDFANRLGPGAHVFVAQQRHRSDFARAMTYCAVLIQNRSNVFSESDGRRRLIRSAGRPLKQENRTEDDPGGRAPSQVAFHISLLLKMMTEDPLCYL